MSPRERVIAVIEHRKPDRVPVYAWVRANLEKQISAEFGSVEAFEDRYEFDFAHLFGGPSPHQRDAINQLRQTHGSIEPAALLDVPLTDPNRSADYENLRQAVAHHKTQRGRFVYVQTPGIFEALNGPFGIENHLCHLLGDEDALCEMYRRQAEWNRAFAMNCLDLGIDMIHVSDDWGAQRGLMFNPEVWWRLIYPHHKITCDAVRARGAYLSLHSDGNIASVLDGVVQLGYHVVHPFQESAGMDYAEYWRKYADKFVVMGGLDVQTTIGFGDHDRLRAEIERVLTTFANGNLLYCTTHFIQDHCTMAELRFAYDLIYKLVRGEKP